MRALAAFCCVALLLGGCRPEGKSLEASEVLNLQTCERVKAGAARVTFAEIAAIRGSKLIDLNALDSAQGDSAKKESPKKDNISLASTASDVSANNAESGPLLVVVSKGRQTTGGYGFELEQAELNGNQVDLHLRWNQPAAGNVQPQMLTSPCIVVALARSDYQKVVARDSAGIIGEVQL